MSAAEPAPDPEQPAPDPEQPAPDPDSPGACSSVILGAKCTDKGESLHSCTDDTDCTEGPFGRCIQGFGMIGAFCGCEYACEVDADCAQAEVCVCIDELRGHYEHSICVPAQCQTGADCASGACDLSLYYSGCWHEALFACRSELDQCVDAGDCGPDSTCAFDQGKGAWTCQDIMCIIGRPLLIEGAARVAASTTRSDWLLAVEVGPGVSQLDAARLAGYWTEVAALEHASVASFARFTLELLALGAPPELVADAQRAAMDEVEHARFAWSLASAYAGRPLGPGPLRMDDIVVVRELAAMVASLVEEGCIGETLGAAEAGLLAEEAAAPDLHASLRKISSDEQRHAALAWRTLRWLVVQYGDLVRGAAQEAADAAERALAADLSDAADDFSAPGLGVLARATLRKHRRDTLQRVVRPILDAVLGPAAA